jgi:CheY-like chemotaxis protein
MSTKGTILVVDNESDQLTMMKEILGRIGYDARTTDRPRVALEMVETQPFELIIIDLIMSEIDGTELCEQIKRIRPSARVFAFSGHAHLYEPTGWSGPGLTAPSTSRPPWRRSKQH